MSSAAQGQAVERLVRQSVAQVDAIAGESLRGLLPVLRQARDELRRDLQEWLRSAPGADERFTAFQRTRALRALEASIDRTADFEPAMASGLRAARLATGPLAVANLEHEVTRLSAIFGGATWIPDVQTAAVIARGDKLLWKQHARSAARYAGAAGDEIQRMLAVGLAKGETFAQLTTRLRRIGNPRARQGPIEPGVAAGEIADGLFRRNQWWAERLVRTEAMHAYATVHTEAIAYANEHRPDGEPELVRVWDSTVDSRRCELCKSLHGKQAPIGGEFPGGIKGPPAHAMCRCVELAWLDRWGKRPPVAPPAPKSKPVPRPEEEGGFRVGVSGVGGARTTGAPKIIERAAPPVAPGPMPAPPPRAPAPAPPREPARPLYRTPDAGPKIVRSIKPAPVGFEALWHEGETYYRHVISGRYYTAAQMAERERERYAIVLGGPNAQRAGFELLETKTARMASSELRYRSLRTGRTYTADEIASGAAAEAEDFAARPARKEHRIVSLVRKILRLRKP